MAFGQRTATLAEPYELVLRSDPAIDTAVDQWEDKYRRYLEMSDLRALESILRPGAKPSVFRLRHLYGEALHQLKAAWTALNYLKSPLAREATYPDVCWLACRLALIGWSNVPALSGGELEFRDEVDSHSGVRRVSDATMGELQRLTDDGQLPYDIGSRVFEVTFLSPKS